MPTHVSLLINTSLPVYLVQQADFEHAREDRDETYSRGYFTNLFDNSNVEEDFTDADNVKDYEEVPLKKSKVQKKQKRSLNKKYAAFDIVKGQPGPLKL